MLSFIYSLHFIGMYDKCKSLFLTFEEHTENEKLNLSGQFQINNLH